MKYFTSLSSVLVSCILIYLNYKYLMIKISCPLKRNLARIKETIWSYNGVILVVILVYHKTSFWYFGLFNDISDNMLFWKCPKLSRWIFLSVDPYACCQNSASHSYKINLFRAIFLILNYPELLNEVSVLLKTCKNVQTDWWIVY